MIESLETDIVCPRCGVAKLWVIDTDFNNIFFVDHLQCSNCGYQEEYEREMYLDDEDITDEEYNEASRRLG